MNDFHDHSPDPGEIAAKYVEDIQPLIRYCYNCQPWEGGQIAVWVQGERTDLVDLFGDAGVPADEEVRKELAAQLECLNCGTAGFDLATEVGIESKWERELGERFVRAQELYAEKISDFQGFLERTPMLGAAHEFGELIFKAMRAPTAPRCKASGKFFRARPAEGARLFDKKDLDAPPEGKALDARFNHAGQTVLYLACSEEVALSEAAGDEPSALLWLQEFELAPVAPILDLSVRSVDLSDDQILFFALLEFDALEKRGGLPGSTWKPGYLLTRFIADCANRSGYVGIRYPSAHAGGDNLVIFERESLTPKLSVIGEPRSIAWKRRRWKF